MTDLDLFGHPALERRASDGLTRADGGSDEWLTPPDLIEKLGVFDLDPCSPGDRRPWDTAKTHYSAEQDGLRKPWSGRRQIWVDSSRNRAHLRPHRDRDLVRLRVAPRISTVVPSRPRQLSPCRRSTSQGERRRTISARGVRDRRRGHPLHRARGGPLHQPARQAMNALPVVTVSRADGGHQALCSCGWELWDADRPTVDLEATRHRASHGKGQ